jgi:type II secretory pathway pseudopilin PulG
MRYEEEDNTVMRSSQSDDRGFVLVVLMVILGMTALWMTAALPTWAHNARREKEAELVFRGEQYVRALVLYERKFGPGSAPQDLKALYDAKVLRQQWKDPISGEDFLPLYRSGVPAGPGAATPPAGQQPSGPGQGGALIGVQSKSTDTSILVYKGATHYNEWQFIKTATPPQNGQRGGANGQRPGGPGGPGRPGGPGGPGGRNGGPVGIGPGRGVDGGGIGRPGGAGPGGGRGRGGAY